jgi:hypothetical protein
MSATETEEKVDVLPKEQVSEVQSGTVQPDPSETTEVAIITDGAVNVVTIDEKTGEVISVDGAPDDTAGIEEIVNWVGGRRAFAQAKAEGLKVERDLLLKRINEQYNPSINYYTRFADWTIMRYFNQLREYAARALVGKKTKTLKFNMLTMKFSLTREKTEILEGMDTEALIYVKQMCPTAIAVKENILKTELKAAVEAAIARRAVLKEAYEAAETSEEAAEIKKEYNALKKLADTDLFKEHGIYFNPGGEETFRVD